MKEITYLLSVSENRLRRFWKKEEASDPINRLEKVSVGADCNPKSLTSS
jgi:hypothetical protein